MSQSEFDMPDKSRGWHTAFYYFAEHIRISTNGAFNHKKMYALLGEHGRYINHANPKIRKSTAASLSRLVHSSRYAEDMLSRLARDPRTFSDAAAAITGTLVQESGRLPEELAEGLEANVWPDVRHGLANEAVEGRTDLDLARADREMSILLSHADSACGPAKRLQEGIEALIYLIAMGHLNPTVMHAFCDAQSTQGLRLITPPKEAATHACLVRFSGKGMSQITGIWKLDGSREFTMGRYTDCDAIESSPGISRIHWRIELDPAEGAWQLFDLGSLNGTVVVRNGQKAYDSATQGDIPFKLEFGDHVIAAGMVDYWFGSVHTAKERPSRI